MLLPVDMERVMELTDQTLWARAQAGDAAAFGALYQRHARAVYQFCFWRTADAGLAEDLSAAVFLEAWRRHGRTYLTQPSVLPWLLGVAVNLLRNQRRTARRQKGCPGAAAPAAGRARPGQRGRRAGGRRTGHACGPPGCGPAAPPRAGGPGAVHLGGTGLPAGCPDPGGRTRDGRFAAQPGPGPPAARPRPAGSHTWGRT